jgi:hypothetical protein
MEISHVEHTRRSKTQNRQKRPKKAIFGGFKALAKSGVEVLQKKKFSCEVQSIYALLKKTRQQKNVSMRHTPLSHN